MALPVQDLARGEGRHGGPAPARPAQLRVSARRLSYRGLPIDGVVARAARAPRSPAPRTDAPDDAPGPRGETARDRGSDGRAVARRGAPAPGAIGERGGRGDLLVAPG